MPYKARGAPVGRGARRSREDLGLLRPDRRQLILTREAGEGDHAKHGGGGDPKRGGWACPLHRLRRSPSPVSRGRIATYRFESFALYRPRSTQPRASASVNV